MLLAIILSLNLHAAQTDTGVSVMGEAQKLEHQKSMSKLDPAKLKRLAEIYFLTSRCPDLRALIADRTEVHPQIYCICGGVGCENDPYHMLKSRLAKGEEFNSREVQKLYETSLQMNPNETKYMVLKELRNRQSGGEEISKALISKMNQLESELDAIER